MKNKNAFTLIEVTVVVLLLALLTVIIVPKIKKTIENKKNNAYESVINTIEESAKSFAYLNVNDVDGIIEMNNEYFVSISRLKELGLLKNELINPITKEEFPNDGAVRITKTNDTYKIEYVGIENITLYSKLIIQLLGGTIDDNPAGYYEENEVVTLPTPEKSNYMFCGWRKKTGNGILSGNTISIGEGTIVLEAIWTVSSELVVNLNGGEMDDNPAGFQPVGDTIELSTPYKNNYVFTGWTKNYGNGVLSGNSILIGTEKTSIEAHWKELEHTLTFDANGGTLSAELSTKTLLYMEVYGDFPTPTRTDYTFAGWYTTASDGTRVKPTDTVTDDQDETLYAHWVRDIPLFTAVQENTYEIPEDGYYQLEVWGASGGNYNSLKGGYGGYSVGIINLKAGTTIYINVGGTTTSLSGGYNGGGKGGSETGRGGGGATHIATESGLLSTLSSNKDKILIVAGGGGGAEGYSSGCLGGSGGGEIGVFGNKTANASYNLAGGGTQTSGGAAKYSGGYVSYPGAFGKGGNSNTAYGGAGGGGYYGGGGGGSSAVETYSGGGGSGYIGNSSLTNKYMYCYGCTESTTASTYTINTRGTSALRDTTACPSGFSTSPISKCAKSGHGYAKITYVGY